MANISKIQFLRSPTAGKVPAAAQLADGELALNTTDRVIYTKVGTNVIPMNDGYGKSLLIANRFSELKGQGISNLKEMLNNIEAQGTRPWPLEQFQGTGSAITALGDPRLTEGNNTITINSNAITDGPVGYGAQLSASVMVNIRRAYNAGMSLAQILYVSGTSFVRTSGSITTAGTWAWNGLTTGADANGWRKQFDSAVLPSLTELGAAKSGVNADITQMNALTLVRGGDTNFDGSIYQIGAARTFQNNYRIGLIRDRIRSGAAVNPYLTFVQKDVGDGDLLPTVNRAIGCVEYKVASPTSDDYAGRGIGSYQVLLDPSGSGITQLATYDTDGIGTTINVYAANGNVNIRNKSVTSLTANFGCFSIGNLTNLSNSPAAGQPLLAVHTRDTGTSAGASTFLGHNGGTPEAPVYSHYFRGKGTTNVDTQLGLRVAKDTALLGALTVTGGTDFNGVVNFNSHDTAVTFSSSNASYPIIGINYSSAGNFGFWDRTPNASKWMLRRDTAVNTVWHLDGGLSLEYADATLSNITLASDATDVYLRNVLSDKYLQLKNDGTLAYSNQKIYHEGNKPTAADVAALPIIGGTITGALTVNGTFTGNGNVMTPNAFLATGAYGSTSGFRLSAAGAGSTGVFIGQGDGASYTTQNMDIKSWYGVGFSSSQGTNGTTVVINTRSGDISARGTISSGNMGIFQAEVRTLSQDSYRLTSGNASVYQHFDGNTWYFMLADTATGGYNGLRPLSINKSTGDISLGNSLRVGAGLDVVESISGLNLITRNDVLIRGDGRRHIVFSNSSGSSTDGFIYKDYNGTLYIAAGGGTYEHRTDGVFLTAHAQVNGGLNVGGNGNGWGNGITIGDNDSGIRSGGDGIIQIWCNNARKVHVDGGQLYSDVDINSAGNGSFNNVYIRSDINFKKNLVKLPGLDALNELTGYSYDVKQISDSGEKWTKSAGLIAQDAQKVLPDAVTEDANGLNLNYNAVIALLVNSVKELQAQVEELKAKV